MQHRQLVALKIAPSVVDVGIVVVGVVEFMICYVNGD